MDRISCISIDLINADKPPASLAFLAGACEFTNKEYICCSLNNYMLKGISDTEYIKLYNDIKRGELTDLSDQVIHIIDVILDKISNFNSDGIAISVFSHQQMPLAEVFLTALKRRLPNIPVIAGGPGIGYQSNNTTNGKLLLEKNLIDYYCLGEGDIVLPEWLKGNTSVLGLNHKGQKFESWVPQIDDLDSNYLIPSYRKIDVSAYHNLESKEGAIFSLSTSRGCVRDCSFCSVNSSWKKFRFRSGKNVVAEILKHHSEVGATHFTIVDSLINGSLKSFHDFNLEMIKLKQEYPTLANFSYNGMFIVRSAKSHPEKLYADMAAAGCESLAIGVETGSDRLRFEMNKKFTTEDLDYHFEMCQRYKIRNILFMFVGYPTETKDDFQQSLDMLDRYQKYLVDDTILGINHSGVFGLLEDTPVFEQKDNIGIIWEHNENNVVAMDWFNINNPELTVKERILRDLQFRQHALNLRYPIPYSDRYLEYLNKLDTDSAILSD